MSREEDKSKTTPPTLFDGFKSISFSDITWQNIGKMPCARTALLTGLSIASLLGASRFIVTKRPISAGNWFVFSFVVSSSIGWEYCHLQRKVAQENLSHIIQVQRCPPSAGEKTLE
jgi:hypothetical protein